MSGWSKRCSEFVSRLCVAAAGMGCAASSGGTVGPAAAADAPQGDQPNSNSTEQERMLNTGDDFFAGGGVSDADYEDPVLRYQGRPHATSVSQKPFRVQSSFEGEA